MSTLKELQENIRKANKVNLKFGHYITEKQNILLVLNNSHAFLMPNFEQANKFLKERIDIQSKFLENEEKRKTETEKEKEDYLNP